jgi:hypothetical protein
LCNACVILVMHEASLDGLTLLFYDDVGKVSTHCSWCSGVCIQRCNGWASLDFFFFPLPRVLCSTFQKLYVLCQFVFVSILIIVLLIVICFIFNFFWSWFYFSISSLNIKFNLIFISNSILILLIVIFLFYYIFNFIPHYLIFYLIFKLNLVFILLLPFFFFNLFCFLISSLIIIFHLI